MAEVSSTFTGVGVSSNMDLPAKGEDVTYTFSGGTDVIHQLEKEVGSPGSGMWQIVLGPYTDDDNSDSPVVYTTKETNERLRARCTSYGSGTLTYAFADGLKQTSLVKDSDGNTVYYSDQDGMVLPNALKTEANVGTVAGSGVTVKEYGDGIMHKTVFTLVNAKIPQVSSGAAVGVGSLKIYDFPTGAIFRMGLTADLALTIATADQADFTDNTPEGDIGIGSLTMGNADAFGTDATDDDWGTGVTYAMTAWADADVAINSEAALMLNDGGTDADLFLSALTDDADFDDSTTSDGITVNGTITVLWLNCGQFA